MYKEINILKEQVSELNELKEHVAYLFNVIQTMKEKIKKFGEMYKESKDQSSIEDFTTSMNLISEIVKTNIQTIAEKKTKIMNWKDEKGRKKLVDHLKTSLLTFVSTY
jgi:inorganic pyrophosphatase